MTLQTYKNVNTSPINEDIYETLSPLEKELSKLLTAGGIRGKRGRKVAVFFERQNEGVNGFVGEKERSSWCTC